MADKYGGALRALRHRNFRLYAVGQAISLTGSWLHNTALSWLMYSLTHSEWMLGLVSVTVNLPILLLGPVGGAAADRFPRRRIVLFTQSVFLLHAAALALLTFAKLVQPWHVLTLGLSMGIANAFDIPARQSMLLDLTGPDDLISAISLNSMIFNLARIAGPALGGIAIATVGEAWCFTLNACSFLAVLLGLLLMRLPARPVQTLAATWRETMAHLARHPSALTLLALCALLNAGFSGIFVLNPFFADDIFKRGPTGLGLLTAAMGAGAVVGTYFLARETNLAGLPRVSLISGFTIAISFLAYAISSNFWFSLCLMAAAGGSLMRQNAATNSTVQTSAPAHLRGRIVSPFGMSVVGMAPLGSALFGAVSRLSSPRIAAGASALLCLLATLWAARRLARRSALAAAMLLLTVALLPAAESNLLDRVRELTGEASRLSGFSVKRPVPAAMMSKADLQKYLARKINTEADPKAVETEELVLKRFGFAGPDFKLRETTLELLGEQAAAFYDFQEKKLFVIDPVADDLGAELLIHELGHALADQHFGLRKFLRGAREDDDGALARMAVMEGQAMWLMGAHAAQAVGLKLKDSPELVERLSNPDRGADDEFPVLQKVPLYLRESLTFPYSHGMRFQAAVCVKFDDCLSRVFRDPPASSAQILHPELYFARTQPKGVAIPPSPRKGKWKARAEGNLGEFDFDLLLRTFGQEKTGIAAGWRGGGYRLLEEKNTHNLLLQHASVWKDADAARRWFEAYEKVLAAKWKSFVVLKRSADLVEGGGDHGPFQLRLAGATVTAEEGLPVN